MVVRSNVESPQPPTGTCIRLPGRMQLDTSLPWVRELLRQSPLAFAAQGECVFIHKALTQRETPRPLLTAFAICAACASLNSENRDIFFQALDLHAAELMNSDNTNSLVHDLARLQAAVLYQVIRLFHGNLEHQETARQQEFVIRAWALRLLHRANVMEEVSTQTWEEWILAESVRRTVFVAFKMYSIYMAFRFGLCAESKALEMLPVSRCSGRAWGSKDFYESQRSSAVARRSLQEEDGMTTATELARDVGVVGQPNVGAFERVVLSAACYNIAEVFQANIGQD